MLVSARLRADFSLGVCDQQKSGLRDRHRLAKRGLPSGCSKLGWDVSRSVPLLCVFYLQMGTFWRADARTRTADLLITSDK